MCCITSLNIQHPCARETQVPTQQLIAVTRACDYHNEGDVRVPQTAAPAGDKTQHMLCLNHNMLICTLIETLENPA